MEKFRSTKVIDGFSTCFRQEKSAPIHCSKLHGYSISFEVTFEGELDFRQWVVDFGFMKRNNNFISWWDGKKISQYTVDGWFKYMFDHSVLVAIDDTQLQWFKEADQRGILQLREVEFVGCEQFAKLVYIVLDKFIQSEFYGRIKVVSVTCREHNKNSATYINE